MRALNLLLPSCVAWSCHGPGRARAGGGGADCARVQRERTNRRAWVDTRDHLLTYCPEVPRDLHTDEPPDSSGKVEERRNGEWGKGERGRLGA